MVFLPRLPGIDRLAPHELAELVRVAADVGVSPQELAVVIYYESNFNTRAKNPTSSASGLLQWMEATAVKLGTTTAQIREMTATQQLGLARRYLGWYRGRMRVPGDVYIAVFWPAGLGKGDDFVMTRDPEKQYALNAGLLDRDKDGAITNGDIRARVKATLAAYPHTVPVDVAAGLQTSEAGAGLVAAGLLGWFLLWRATA